MVQDFFRQQYHFFLGDKLWEHLPDCWTRKASVFSSLLICENTHTVFEGCFSAEDNHLHEAKRRQTDYTLSGPRILILIYLYSLYIFIYSCILYIII